MNFETLFNNHFQDALKISAICIDLHLPRSDSKLFTYIYIKGKVSGEGTAYFDTERPHDVKAIEALLGISSLDDGPQVPAEGIEQDLESIKNSVHTLASRDLKNIENKLEKEHGIESAFTPELYRRLRLYKDDNFRKDKIETFIECIKPKIEKYTKEDIFRAHKHYYAAQQRRDEQLEMMLAG